MEFSTFKSVLDFFVTISVFIDIRFTDSVLFFDPISKVFGVTLGSLTVFVIQVGIFGEEIFAKIFPSETTIFPPRITLLILIFL